MATFSPAVRLEELIASCQRCRVVDKPYVKYGVYGWLPRRVKTLAIGESPPPGKKEGLLYNLQAFDRLRLSLKLVLNLQADGEVLETLRRLQVFFTAAVKCRPPSLRSLQAMRPNCVYLLREELRLLKPSRVVAMGRTAAASLSEILNLKPPETVREIVKLKVGGFEVAFTPHPNYLFRFGRHLIPQVRSLLTRP